jgi:DNA-binding CsgD family transcriptional regulator
MNVPERIDLDLLERIYDIPLQASDWDDVLLSLRARMRADAGTFLVYGEAPGDVRKVCLSGRDDASWREYAAHFAAIDPFRAAMRTGAIRPGAVTSDTRVFSRTAFESGEFYNDFWRRQCLGYSAGGHAQDADGNWIQLGLPRGLGVPDYTERELVELRFYFLHIVRVLELERAVGPRDAGPDLDVFAARYGLTPAELKLVEALLQAGSLPRAARLLGRSHNTLRAHLRSILGKTAAHSQVELIKRIYRPSNIASDSRR